MWLREYLLEKGSAFFPGREPVVVEEWTDPSPVGERELVMVAVGGDLRSPRSPTVDEMLAAFVEDGWVTHGSHGDFGETWAGAKREGHELLIYEGDGPGILTFTGWTELPGAHTISTVRGAVLCYQCEGLGACDLCLGTGRYEGRRCPECTAGNNGPGRCTICGVTGYLDLDRIPDWARKAYKGADAEPVVEELHAKTNAEALSFIVRRSCATCGEVRCRYRNEVVAATDHVISRLYGMCPRCGQVRDYRFHLPYRRIPPPLPVPDPPECPQCATPAVPLVRGLSTRGAREAMEEGLLAQRAGGCQVRPDDPNWKCLACGHEWRDEDRARLKAILKQILSGRSRGL